MIKIYCCQRAAAIIFLSNLDADDDDYDEDQEVSNYNINKDDDGLTIH